MHENESRWVQDRCRWRRYVRHHDLLQDQMLTLCTGPGGLTALKELRELGADVTLFERRRDVGGLWSWTEDTSITAALRETQICNSKFYVRLRRLHCH